MTLAIPLEDVANLDDSRDDIITGIADLEDALPGYRMAEEVYEGTAQEFFASQSIARKIRKSGDVFRVNVAKKAVSAVTDRLEIAAVTVPDNEAATQRLMEEVWTPNELALEAPTVHENACKLGDDYVFLTEEEDGSVVIERSGAMTTRIIYDPERPRRIAFGIKVWTEGRRTESADTRKRRANLYYPEDDPGGARCEKWVTVQGSSNGTDPQHWTPYIGRDGDTESWLIPLERFPIYHFRTARPYGLPLHKEAYGPQAALNKIVATLMATMDQHGYPIRYALTDGALKEEGDADAEDFGDVLDFPERGMNSEVYGDPSLHGSKLKSGPGQLWWLDGVKGAGQFDAAKSDVFLEPAEWFLRMMAQACDMPLHFFDPGGDQPSGDSRRTAEGTLTKKVDHLELSFESTWSRLLTDALDILGISVERVDVRWTPSTSVDDADFWTTATTKINAGVPVRQVLLEGGYDATQVTAWLEDSSEQDLARKIALVAALAAAARDLGTAAGMGVLDPALVSQIMATALPEATADPA